MHRYRFEISVNGFLLKNHFTATEKSGLDWCKRYMSKFQRQVANLPMKIAIYDRGKKANNWEYHGATYHYVKTLIKRPLIKKEDNSNE